MVNLVNELGQRISSLRLKDVELPAAAEIQRISQRRAKDIIGPGGDGIGHDRRPLAQGLCEICAQQQRKQSSERAGCIQLQICTG